MALDPVTATLVGEGVKVGFQLLFTQLTLLGKTPEEIDQIFATRKEKFFQNLPSHLEDV